MHLRMLKIRNDIGKKNANLLFSSPPPPASSARRYAASLALIRAVK
jgi:hypothetical protein